VIGAVGGTVLSIEHRLSVPVADLARVHADGLPALID
jgi:hypothetical protein